MLLATFNDIDYQWSNTAACVSTEECTYVQTVGRYMYPGDHYSTLHCGQDWPHEYNGGYAGGACYDWFGIGSDTHVGTI